MLNEEQIREQFILFMSGAAKVKQGFEVEMRSKNITPADDDEYSNRVKYATTIEFVSGASEVIERYYYDSGGVRAEKHYKNGKLCGLWRWYKEDGTVEGEMDMKGVE